MHVHSLIQIQGPQNLALYLSSIKYLKVLRRHSDGSGRLFAIYLLHSGKNKSGLNYYIGEMSDQTDTKKPTKALRYKSKNKQNVISYTNATRTCFNNRSAWTDVIFFDYILDVLVTLRDGIFCATLKQLYWILIYYDSHRLFHIIRIHALLQIDWHNLVLRNMKLSSS